MYSKLFLRVSYAAVALFSATMMINCAQLGLESEDEDDNDLTIALLAAAAVLNSPVKLNFNIVSGTQNVRCGTNFTVTKAVNGSTTRTMNPQDLRFYISNLRMIGADGVSQYAVNFANDGVWQYEGAALLDFEDGTGSCVGSSSINTSISGITTAASYSGVIFDLGLPTALNQLSNSTSPSPLNVNAMYWSWASGYKFTRLEFSDTGTGNIVRSHLGSQNCGGNISTNSCANPFRSEVRVTTTSGFNPVTGTIALDLNEFMNNFDATGGSLSCMPLKGHGAATAGELANCPKLLTQVGLDSGGQATGSQTTFVIQ